MKICSKCKEEKDESEFCKDKSRKDGLRNNCIVCSSIISKKHREENKEKIKEDKKEYYQEHKEEISERNKKNREVLNKKERIKRKTDENFRITQNLRRRLRQAYSEYSITGKIKNSKDIGIDFEAIIRHLGPCPGNREDYHIHHIIALCSFNFDDPEQVKLAFAPENHQWLTKEENLKRNGEDKKSKRRKNE